MLHLHEVDDYIAFDEDECRSVGASLHRRYSTAKPFPHIVMDDFLSEHVLDAVLDEFPAAPKNGAFDRDQERLKFQHEPRDQASGLIRNLFAELNGRAFLSFLEEMTGIRGLIADPYFEGGGLHETKRGGHLGVHADFNLHEHLRLERRLNLLIYLNKDWSEEFGGCLELWNQDMTECTVRIKPTFGRAVIFSTTLESYHGHPDPLNCPPDRSRRSIATYYYTAVDEALNQLPKRTTNFRARPGSQDRRDWKVARHHFINDWVPPRLQRVAHRWFG